VLPYALTDVLALQLLVLPSQLSECCQQLGRVIRTTTTTTTTTTVINTCRHPACRWQRRKRCLHTLYISRHCRAIVNALR
jgi:hypothetical protein